MKVLVTGCTGFIGRFLSNTLALNHEVVGVCRKGVSTCLINYKVYEVDDYFSYQNWAMVMDGIDVIVHTAGRAHVMRDEEADVRSAYSRANTDLTVFLAHIAAKSGVKRFVFLSSIKVNGEFSKGQAPFTDSSPADPIGHYAQSKHAAELSLGKLSVEKKLEHTIVRLPLVYGPGVKGNFSALAKLMGMHIPLPLGRTFTNKRSMIGIQNLVDFIETVLAHPNAANNLFLVSDNNDLSTLELVRFMKSALNSRSPIIPVPLSLMTLVARLLGGTDKMTRLFGDLQVDISSTVERLGWTPVTRPKVGITEALSGKID